MVLEEPFGRVWFGFDLGSGVLTHGRETQSVKFPGNEQQGPACSRAEHMEPHREPLGSHCPLLPGTEPRQPQMKGKE